MTADKGKVTFNDKYRMIWMFPRNIRRISPWKIAQIATLLRDVVSGESWKGRQDIQNSFCKALEAAGLKRPGEQYDPHSGGPRTYLAQLKCLGVLFQDSQRQILYTQAGDELATGNAPLPILQDLLLKHQYPSCYSNLTQIKMNPGIRVKPFLFVMRLLRHKDIASMTVQELIIPVVYGHNTDCFELCVEKILKLRKTGDIKSVIDNYSVDLYTPRTKGKDIESRLSDVNDVANTMKNWMQAACLVDCETVDGIQKISIAQSALKKVEAALACEDHFIEYESEESFQRKYGCLHAEKDTRNLRPVKEKSFPEKNIILSQFFEYMGNNIPDGYPEDFVTAMRERLGIAESVTRQVIEPHLSKSLSFFESTYLELATGGTATALSFEKATAQILSSRLKFNARLTGQLKRPGKGGYSDIFVIALDNVHCGIIDGKASPSYRLSSDDYYKMRANYIPNYRELTNGVPLKLEFCSYVAGGFGNIASSLKKLTAETGIGASALPAFELLRLAQVEEVGSKQPSVMNTLKTNKVLTLADFKFNG